MSNKLDIEIHAIPMTRSEFEEICKLMGNELADQAWDEAHRFRGDEDPEAVPCVAASDL